MVPVLTGHTCLLRFVMWLSIDIIEILRDTKCFIFDYY